MAGDEEPPNAEDEPKMLEFPDWFGVDGEQILSMLENSPSGEDSVDAGFTPKLTLVGELDTVVDPNIPGELAVVVAVFKVPNKLGEAEVVATLGDPKAGAEIGVIVVEPKILEDGNVVVFSKTPVAAGVVVDKLPRAVPKLKLVVSAFVDGGLVTGEIVVELVVPVAATAVAANDANNPGVETDVVLVVVATPNAVFD